jgi:four helix bundle protein
MHDENSAVRSYRDLTVWQRAIALAETIYKITRTFPREEVYGLISQMRRAAVSVASNIAEGNARQTRGEYLQFLGIARSSLAELNTQTTITLRMKLIATEFELPQIEQLDEVGRLLNALRNSISAIPDRKRSGPSTTSNP